VLWIAVLLRLVAPAIVPIPLLPGRDRNPLPVETNLVGPSTAPPVEDAMDPTLSPSTAAAVAWGLGALVLAAVATARIRSMAAIVGRSRPAPDALQRRGAAVASRLSVPAPPILLSDRRMPPFLWAVGRRPTIVIPEALLEALDDDQTEALIAHETVHLARRDHWVRWLELVVTTACWWNPLAWLASRQLRRVEERSCDERVVATFPERSRAYAESLITTLRFLSTARTSRVPAAAGMADLSEVQGRLTDIMRPNAHRPIKTLARWALAAIVATVLLASPMLIAAAKDSDGLPDVFDEPITLELEDAAAGDVMATISTVTGTPFVLGGDTTAAISVSAHDMTVRTLLDHLGTLYGIEWHVEDGPVVHVFVPRQSDEPELVGTHNGKQVYRVAEGVLDPPIKLGGPVPAYPEEAREAGISGVVVLDTLIDDEGIVQDIVVERSPDESLSDAAMRAVEQWTFQPALLEGEPVTVRFILTVNFRLQ
jgi:TonB family protein